MFKTLQLTFLAVKRKKRFVNTSFSVKKIEIIIKL